jgi:predicted kinase
MPTLHLMVGLPCSGKTSLAKKLERELPALRLTTDEWHIRLFGQDAEDPQHNARHTQIEELLWNIAARALELGVDVILDFGFWAREEREDYRSRARHLGAASEIHYLDVSPGELLIRLKARNAQTFPDSFLISESAMLPWIASFQKPASDELERRE